MIHIATVHFKNNRWLDIQLRYFATFLDKPYRIWAICEEFNPGNKPCLEVIAAPKNCDHGEKLNVLAGKIYFNRTSEDDTLIFCDGDAFPVAPLHGFLERQLKSYPLIAIQRQERFGDIHPHPAFCATTIGFWHTIGGDWRKGHTWKNQKKELTDTGGNLLRILQDRNINWYRMLRSNNVNLHQVFYGIYDDVIYHHGAGFREPIEDTDKYLHNIHARKQLPLSKILDRVLRTRYAIPLKWKLHPALRKEADVCKKNRAVSDTIYREILINPGFADAFKGKAPGILQTLKSEIREL